MKLLNDMESRRGNGVECSKGEYVMKFQTGENHPKWKGGRSVSSHGYVLIRLPEHPKANKHGYVYEHILVAENKIGRPLKKGEIVHHLDENKQNNGPSNIHISKSIAHHKFHHRKNGFNRRLPDEFNPIVERECGCGVKFRKYDESGRPRRFVIGGHWRRILTNSKVAEITRLLENGYPKTKIATMLGINRKTVYKAIGD